jgi:cell wall-associated NlpC family hydrolase
MILALAGSGATAGPAPAEPSGIAAKRAEVARIERDIAAIDARVGHAAEAYNGARWRLGLVQERIRENRRTLVLASRNLRRARDVLADRVRHIYKQGEPSTAEVLLSSASIVSAVDRIELLDRIERQDATIVHRIRDFRARARTTRARLLEDRERARDELAAAERAKVRVEALLRRRRAVLGQARGELARMIAAEQARERREAEIARQRALAAQREAQQDATPPATGAPASPPSPAPPASAPSPSAGDSAPAPALPSGSGNAAAAAVALRYLGVPYRWGGASPSTGFDCSGLASYAYAQIGKSVPHYTGAIWAQFPKVPSDQLQVGDLVFFNGLGHMGIYIGGGRYVHAPHTGDVVKISDLSGRSDYVGAVRP